MKKIQDKKQIARKKREAANAANRQAGMEEPGNILDEVDEDIIFWTEQHSFLNLWANNSNSMARFLVEKKILYYKITFWAELDVWNCWI